MRNLQLINLFLSQSLPPFCLYLQFWNTLIHRTQFKLNTAESWSFDRCIITTITTTKQIKNFFRWKQFFPLYNNRSACQALMRMALELPPSSYRKSSSNLRYLWLLIYSHTITSTHYAPSLDKINNVWK